MVNQDVEEGGSEEELLTLRESTPSVTRKTFAYRIMVRDDDRVRKGGNIGQNLHTITPITDKVIICAVGMLHINL